MNPCLLNLFLIVEKILNRIVLVCRLVDGVADLHLHIAGQPSSFAGAGDHFVGDKFCGNCDQVFGFQFQISHELRYRLLAKITFYVFVHFSFCHVVVAAECFLWTHALLF